MKFIIALTSTLFTSVLATNAEIEFSISTGEKCNFEKVKDAIIADGYSLSTWFSTNSDAKSTIRDLCEDAVSKNSDPKDGACKSPL